MERTPNPEPLQRPLYGEPEPERMTYRDTDTGTYKSRPVCSVKWCEGEVTTRLRIGDPSNRFYFFACKDHRSVPMSVSEALPCNAAGYVPKP